MQDEKYVFQYTTQLFHAFEKFALALQKLQQQQTIAVAASTNPTAINPSVYSIDLKENVEKEAKQLFYALRCISVAQRVSSKVVKTTIGPDKIPNIIKNLSKITPQQAAPVEFDLNAVMEDGRKWALIDDGRKWGSITNKTNQLAPNFLIISCLSLHQHMQNIVQTAKSKRAREASKLAPFNGFYITHIR